VTLARDFYLPKWINPWIGSMIQIEGRNPVYDALKENLVVRVKIAEEVRRDRKVQEIIDLSSMRGVPIETMSRSELNAISVTGHPQGVIAYIKSPQKRSLEQILTEADKGVCVLILDRVQDPNNLGAILRTAEATRVDSIIIPKRGSVSLTPTVHRVSMGGSIYVPVLKESLYTALKLLKKEGFRVVGVDPSGSKDYFTEELTGTIAFVLGGEDRGISPTLLAKCDVVVRIPMLGRLSSLNVTVATAVILYERVRQQLSRAQI